MRRGDLVAVALQGDYGKPRPALIIQADQFADLGSVVILPLTSHTIDAPLLRLTVEPPPDNGLRTPSQIMLDKPMTVKADKTGSPSVLVNPKKNGRLPWARVAAKLAFQRGQWIRFAYARGESRCWRGPSESRKETAAYLRPGPQATGEP